MNPAQEQLIDYLLKDKDFTYLMNNCIPQEIDLRMYNLASGDPRVKAFALAAEFINFSSLNYGREIMADYRAERPTTLVNLEKMKNIIVNNFFLAVCLDKLIQHIKVNPIVGYMIDPQQQSMYNHFSATAIIYIYHPATKVKRTLWIQYVDHIAIATLHPKDLSAAKIRVDISTGSSWHLGNFDCPLGDLNTALAKALKTM